LSRTNSRGDSIRGGTERASLITRLISWLDGYVELNTVDPVRIDRALKGYQGTDLDQIWKSVRGDVNQINALPEKSKDLERYARRASNSRKFSLLIGAATFAVLIGYLLFQNQIKAVAGYDAELAIPGVMLVLLYGMLMLTMMSTRSLNKKMRQFYEEHSGELTKQKSHLRDATQQLIDRLSREIYSHNFNPGRFKFNLYHSNYKNIAVVGRSGGKFISTVKPRISSQQASKQST
jgi:hypothetical protein